MLSGRNSNLRLDEDSSLFRSDLCKSIIQKAFTKEPLENLYSKNNIGGLTLLHSSVSVADLILNALKQTYVFNVFSDPSLLVYSWLKSGYGRLCTYEKKGIAVPLLLFKGNRIPIYAYQQESEFLELDEVGRICLMLSKLSNADFVGYEALSDDLRERVMLLDYTKFLESKEIRTSVKGILFDVNFFDSKNFDNLLQNHQSRYEFYAEAKVYCEKYLKNNIYFSKLKNDYIKFREILDEF